MTGCWSMKYRSQDGVNFKKLILKYEVILEIQNPH